MKLLNPSWCRVLMGHDSHTHGSINFGVLGEGNWCVSLVFRGSGGQQGPGVMCRVIESDPEKGVLSLNVVSGQAVPGEVFRMLDSWGWDGAAVVAHNAVEDQMDVRLLSECFLPGDVLVKAEEASVSMCAATYLNGIGRVGLLRFWAVDQEAITLKHFHE